jgi:hypothetical protein
LSPAATQVCGSNPRARLAGSVGFTQSVPAGTAKNAVGALVVVRTDGVKTRLRGRAALRIFEGDVLRMDGKGKALIETDGGIQVALNGNETVATVVTGTGEFSTLFATCELRAGTTSFGHRSKACTPPAATDVATVVGWSRPLLR